MTIETERLLLRPFAVSDAADVYEYLHEPAVNCFASMRLASLEAAKAEMEKRSTETEYCFAIVLKETGEVIGCVGYLPASAANLPLAEDQAEVGYWVARPYWNQGICTEALRLVVDHCFREKGFTALWGDFFTDNPASGRVMEKCGFTPTGEETCCPKLEVGSDRPVKVMRLGAE